MAAAVPLRPRLEAGHEFTYNRIFGSQIAGLKRLKEVGRATVDDERAFFQPYGERYPQVYSNCGFDGWLGFLRGNSLIVQNGNGNQRFWAGFPAVSHGTPSS